MMVIRLFNRSPDERSDIRDSESRMSLRSCGLQVLGTLVLLCAALPASAQSPSPFSASPFRVTHQDGETIYRTVCAGCHMPDGRGAIGAGAYPALARNAKLEAAGYPVTLVVNGQKAMPPFGRVLDDNQVAAVVNYIRGNLGNAYTDRVSADDVKPARQ
jgi:mono/diheme cytochrome c family protein